MTHTTDEHTPAVDAIEYEDFCTTAGPNEAGMVTQQFLAFNTVITLQAYGEPDLIMAAFDAARKQCRHFERLFSRTLAHSDVAKINRAAGNAVAIHDETAELIEAALHYCELSEGFFDITIGKVVGLWDFHQGIIAPNEQREEALRHVDWTQIHVERTNDGAVTHLDDPQAALDLGGIAKGWIADKLTALLASFGLTSFIVNLGGNVMAYGAKPNGDPWRIGLQDPFNKDGIVGTVTFRNASAVTSGTYERSFERDGIRYHHILHPKTGLPVDTDAAGVTVITRASLDAEGFSTTLLAMGIERGLAFAQTRPEILNVHFVDENKQVHSLK